MVKIFYTTYLSVDLAHHKIFCANVRKGRINLFTEIVGVYYTM